MKRREFLKGAAALGAFNIVPAAARGDVEMIELVPIALTQLRITLFPWTI